MIGGVYQMRKPRSEEKVKTLLSALCVLAVGWVIGIIFIYSRYVNPSGSLYVERYFTVIQPHIMLITSLGLGYLLDTADKILSIYNSEKCYFLSIITAWFIRGCVLILLITAFISSYRNQYIAIRKPFEQYREAADYLIEEEGIWNEKTLFLGSNKACMLDGFIDYYFEKRGYEPPLNIVDSMVNSKEESRFYRSYAELSDEELLYYDRVYYLKIHMALADDLEQFLIEHYNRVRESDESGIEIWERKSVNQR